MNTYSVGKIALVVPALVAILLMISLSFFSDWQVIYHYTVCPHPEVDLSGYPYKAITTGSFFIALEAGLVYFSLFSKRFNYVWVRSALPAALLLGFSFFSISGSEFYPRFMDIHLYWLLALTLLLIAFSFSSFSTMVWKKLRPLPS